MKTAILSLTLLLLALCQTAQAQQTDTLDIRQQNIVLIASATARGDLNNLKNIPFPWIGQWDDSK